ncbi:helix-turn-helix domain-containing protein [Alicyclobacillus sp. SO9]|uniref:helix-turn-helix domain-containing protein n=1 Tax=Alicyclobacillus sp. SO9 TaxID=2665646 RepID=UPI0018E857EF|nr:helix-turn-helix domain-containing protein [Alicyclobacillus sp. SO9]QQE78698.1 helix-turn-helix domain-containing protein [Alicyclobacillus sp. SO9]
MEPESLSNDELLARIYDGDNRAIGELVKRLEKVIRSEAYLGDSINEDVAQDIREKLIIAIRENFTED